MEYVYMPSFYLPGSHQANIMLRMLVFMALALTVCQAQDDTLDKITVWNTAYVEIQLNNTTIHKFTLFKKQTEISFFLAL